MRGGVAALRRTSDLGDLRRQGKKEPFPLLQILLDSLYGFYDFTAAWKQDLPGRESGATAGLGFAIEYWRVSGFIEVAMPLTHADVEGDSDAKVFAEVRLKL